MSATAPPAPIIERTHVPRGAAIAVAAAGPLAIAVIRGVLPYDTTDDAATLLTKVAAAPGATAAVLWLGYLALLTLPLGVLLIARLAVAARPVFGTVAAVLAWLGFLSLFVGVTPADQVAAATAGLPGSDAATGLDAVFALPVAGVATTVFVAGHIIGAVLLGVALWRVIPRWAAAALIVSQPLHMVFAVIVPNHVLDAAAWTLTAVGFAVAAAHRP